MNFGFTTSYILLWVLVVFQTLVAIGLLREITKLRRLQWGVGQRLPLGSLAPEFSAMDLRSGLRLSSEMLNGHTSVVLFISPAYSLCKNLANSLQLLEHDQSVSILTVCDGDENDCRVFLKGLSHNVPLLLDTDHKIRELYRVAGSPTAVVVNAEKKVRGYGHPRDARDLKELLTMTLTNSDFETDIAEANDEVSSRRGLLWRR